jgi:hypothetical protein
MTFTPYDGVPPENEGQVRVTLHDGSEVLLHDAQQMEDRYVGGLDGGGWYVGCENCRIRSIPIDSIAALEVRETNEGGTVWAIILGAGLVVVGAYALIASSYEFQLEGN